MNAVRSAALACSIGALALGSGIALAEVSQKGQLRVKAVGKFAPNALPRVGTVPIGVYLAGRISTTDASTPPQLVKIRIELNRNGRLDRRGLPVCTIRRIQPASTTRALAACRSALVGSGRFEASIVLAGQEPYPTRGKLLVFNGRADGRPALLGHIFARHPFTTSFVIPFLLKSSGKGPYGTVLTASLPQALGNWGHITAIDMNLSRRYRDRGHPRSFVSAGCPAPQGFPGAIFPLARMTFSFAGQGEPLVSTLTRSCAVSFHGR